MQGQTLESMSSGLPRRLFSLLQDELHHPIASDSSDTSMDANFLDLAAETSPEAIWNSGEESQRGAITRLEEKCSQVFPSLRKDLR
jgi:hypothetical protein